MSEKRHIKAVLKWFGYSRAPIIEAIRTDLEVDLTEYIMTIENSSQRRSRRGWNFFYYNVNVSTLVDCGLQKMYAIGFMSKAIQDITNCGIMPNMELLQEIDMD